jgi:hypothetical protein
LISARDSELCGKFFSAPGRRVSHRHYLRAFHAPPGFGMESREASSADHHAFQWFEIQMIVSSSCGRSS